MKVYAVMRERWDGSSDLYAVCANQTTAENVVRTKMSEWDFGKLYCEYWVTEREVMG